MKISNVLLFASGVVAVIDNRGCLEWCKANFGLLGLATCYAPSFLGQGPCFTCGPHKKITTQELCSKKCVDLNTDNNNCGKCGNKCPTGSSCDAGICRPEATCQATARCSRDPPCPDASCICQPDERGGGKGYCNKGDLCSALTDCQTIKDCPIPGSVCLTTCCPNTAKCMPPDKLCAKPVSRLFRARRADESVDDLYDALEAAMVSAPKDKREVIERQLEAQAGEWSTPIHP